VKYQKIFTKMGDPQNRGHVSEKVSAPVDRWFVYPMTLLGFQPSFWWCRISILGIITPTDELIFFRGVGIPPTSTYVSDKVSAPV
jgi:hypothetical protein